MRNVRRTRASKPQDSGFTLVDVLTATALLSLVTVGVAYSSITASRTLGKITRSTNAAQLAQNKLEELLLINPASLDDGDDAVELGLEARGLDYSRETNITVNPDRTRSITITVRPSGSAYTETTTLTHTVAEWGLK